MNHVGSEPALPTASLTLVEKKSPRRDASLKQIITHGLGRHTMAARH